MSDLMPLDGAPPRPALPGSVVMRPTGDELIDAVAADMLVQAMACVRQFGDFHIALSGGSTPLPLYRRLMYDPAYRQLPWQRTHLWIVDERRVPFDDERSNFGQINDLIGLHADIPRHQVHPIPALEPDADVRYEKELAEVLLWRERGHDRLDYVLLGMGSDAHTASLFPRSPALMAELAEANGHARHPTPPRMVRINAGANVTPPDRVTMTLALLNNARFVSVLVTGASKRPTIERVCAAHATGARSAIADVPIAGVSPRAGELRWYLDHDACPRTGSDGR